MLVLLQAPKVALNLGLVEDVMPFEASLHSAGWRAT